MSKDRYQDISPTYARTLQFMRAALIFTLTCGHISTQLESGRVGTYKIGKRDDSACAATLYHSPGMVKLINTGKDIARNGPNISGVTRALSAPHNPNLAYTFPANFSGTHSVVFASGKEPHMYPPDWLWLHELGHAQQLCNQGVWTSFLQSVGNYQIHEQQATVRGNRSYRLRLDDAHTKVMVVAAQQNRLNRTPKKK